MKLNTTLICLLFSLFIYSQRFKIISGDFKNLKTINEYNLVFDYKDQKVKGYENDDEFIEQEWSLFVKDDKNGKEVFKNEWIEARSKIYEPRFKDYFESMFSKSEIKARKDHTIKHTLLITTKWVTPGYNIGVYDDPSKLTAIIKIFENENPDKILLEVKFEKVYGNIKGQFEVDFSERIASAYEKLAKNFAMQVKRVIK